MSDGLSDMNAVNRLGNDVLEATYELRDALIAADEGHRGMRPELTFLLNRMNEVLRDAGFEIHRRTR